MLDQMLPKQIIDKERSIFIETVSNAIKRFKQTTGVAITDINYKTITHGGITTIMNVDIEVDVNN